MLYKIGDIARIMGVTTEAIRHYERMGLIVPEKDPQTKYRYFTEEQLGQLLYIQRLSKMGIRLQEVRDQFLNGTLDSQRTVINETLQSTLQQQQLLQMKSNNLKNCLEFLQLADESKNTCIFGTRQDMYFLSAKHCLPLSGMDDATMGFQNFAGFADLFFQCNHYCLQNGIWHCERGFGIYKDSADFAHYELDAYFQLRKACKVVICTLENPEANDQVIERICSFFQTHHLQSKGEVYSRQVYRTYAGQVHPILLEMLTIPYVEV